MGRYGLVACIHAEGSHFELGYGGLGMFAGGLLPRPTVLCLSEGLLVAFPD